MFDFSYAISDDIIEAVVSRLEGRGFLPLGERQDIDAPAVRRILELAR